MEQIKCSYCGKMICNGTGKLFVKKDGTLYYLCSSKCQNNMKLGRLSRKLLWIKKNNKREK